MTDSLPMAAAGPAARPAQAAPRGESGTAGTRDARVAEGAQDGGTDFGATYFDGGSQKRTQADAAPDQWAATGPAHPERGSKPHVTRDGAASGTTLLEMPAQSATADTTKPGAALTDPTAAATGAKAAPAATDAAAGAWDPAQMPQDARAVVVPADPVDGATGRDALAGSLATTATRQETLAEAQHGAAGLPSAPESTGARTGHSAIPDVEASRAQGVPPAEERGQQRSESAESAANAPRSRGEIAAAALNGGGAGGAGADPGKGGAGTGLSAVTPDGELSALPAGEGREAASTRPVSTGAEAPRADVPRPAMAQIVEAVRLTRDGAVEVALHPEELGRVRLSLSGGDGALHVNIQSDRPETADLLRRHIAQLQEDLRALGYSDVSFAFGSDARHAGDTGPQSEADFAEEPDAADSVAVATPALDAALRSAGGGGLDLRF